MKTGVSLHDWPVRIRLFAVIVLALVLGLTFAVLRVAGAVSGAEQFGRTAQFARLGEQAVILAGDLENERDQTAGVIAGASPAALKSLAAVANAQAARVRTLAAAVGAGFPADLQSAAAAVGSDAADPSQVQSLARDTGLAPQEIADYAGLISDISRVDGQIAHGTPDSGLADEVQALTALSGVEDQVSQQRALMYNALTLGYFASGTRDALSAAAAVQRQEENAFDAAATPAEAASVSDAFGTVQAESASSIEQLMLSGGATFGYLRNFGVSADPAGQSYRLMSAELDGLRRAELDIARTIVSRADALCDGARTSAALTGLLSLAVLLLVLGAALAVARSLVRPLKRLQEGALQVATVELPERVRRLGEAGEDGGDLEITPIDVTSRDEIGQVARAFDQVHTEAVRLAANEAMLRGSFNTMFVSLSRRSQALIERLARQIDSLEQREEDPDRLAGLFTMDHLVTRMRRNSENLLLMAGHEASRRHSEPVPLADVARAAASEIEQYGRVQVRIGSGTWVAGKAAPDIARLLAELIDNATTFSPKESPVSVTARELEDAGVIIAVADLGVGISPERLTDLNGRLENPSAVDAYVARHTGLFAVARLARRHGAQARLRAGDPRGVTALVWLPETLLERRAPALPVRVPGAGPRPSPERARSTLSGFQRGARRARGAMEEGTSR